MKRGILVVSLYLVGLVVFLAAMSMAHADPAQVCLKDGSGVKCLDVQGGVNTSKVNALLRQAGKLRRQIQEMLDAGNGKAGEVTGNLVDLKKKVKDLQSQISHLDGIAKSGNEDAKKALVELGYMKKGMWSLAIQISGVSMDNRLLAKRVKKLERRKLNLELGAFGGGADSYGGVGGGIVSLALPMGKSGLWTTRLSAGMGLSPSLGLGWIAMGTLTRTLASGRLSAGPAVLAMGDAGDLLSGNKSWLVGGGAEVRLNITHVIHLSAVPFVGAAVTTETRGVGWQEAVYKDTPCGPVLLKEAGWGSFSETRKLKLAAGALGTLTFSLF